MSTSFAGSASRLAGLATRAFGWFPEQFWQATPAELASAFAAEETATAASLSRAELTALIQRDKP